MNRIPTLAALAVTLIISACAYERATAPSVPAHATENEGDEHTDTPADAALSPGDLERRRRARLGSQRPLQELIPAESTTQIIGEVPASLLAVIDADLAARLGIAAGEARVLIAEARHYGDGSLGCPRPDRVYTQATVQGYRIVLEYAGVRYDYRATEHGVFLLCGEPVPARPEP